MSRLLLATLLVLLCFSALPAGPSVAATTQAEPGSYVPGEVVVTFDDGASTTTLGLDASLVRRTGDNGDFVTIAVPPGSEQEMIDRLEGQPGVAAAELNALKQLEFVPNDPLYGLQWGFPMIGADKAWDLTRGGGVTIAVLDTGVAFEDYKDFGRAPELSRTRFVDPYDATTGSAHPNDENGHGTHVTGTIAQDFDDGVGVAGMAPDAAIMPVRVCQPYGCASDDMADGIDWAVQHGADAINMSLGGSTITRVERDAIARAETQGVVIVAAAGNGGGDFQGDNRLVYPAAVETVIAVGAVDTEAVRSPYSNYGEGEGEGDDGLLVFAPGGNLNTDKNNDGQADGVLQQTFVHACGGGPVDYRVFKDCMYHGTSMATPHVTGAVAMLLSLFPALSPAQVRSVIGCTALDLGLPGVDEEYGAGLLQVDAALSDPDEDGIPACAEKSASVFFTARGGMVAPQGEITLDLDAAVNGGQIGGYDIDLSFNTGIITAIGCQAVNGGVCTVEEDHVNFSAADAGPLQDDFRIGRVTFRAQDETDIGSYLHVVSSATPYHAHDPPPIVEGQDAFLWVQDVPNTVSGDANCDGDVSPADVALTLRTTGSFSGGFCEAYGDVNCSGAVEPLDVIATLTFLAGLEPTLPVGCPAIGSAATT